MKLKLHQLEVEVRLYTTAQEERALLKHFQDWNVWPNRAVYKPRTFKSPVHAVVFTRARG